MADKFDDAQKRFNKAIDKIDDSIKERSVIYHNANFVWCVLGIGAIIFGGPVTTVPVIAIAAMGGAVTLVARSRDKTLDNLQSTKARMCEDFAQQTPALPAPAKTKALPPPSEP